LTQTTTKRTFSVLGLYRPSESATFTNSSYSLTRNDSTYKLEFENPFYKSQISRRQQAGTARTLKKVEYGRFSPQHVDITWKSANLKDERRYKRIDTGYGLLGSGTWVPPGQPSSLTHSPIAIASFYAQAVSTEEVFSGATELLEARKTMEGIRHPYSGIRDALRNRQALLKASKGAIKTAVGWRRQLAASWLETQFSVKPLVSSIEQLATKLLKTSDLVWSKRLVATHVDQNIFPKTFTAVQQPSYRQNVMRGKVMWKREDTRRTKIVGAVVCRPPSVARSWGFNPGAWVLAGWEVIPASFLVDYLIPIGGWLEALNYRKASIAWTSTTTVVASKDTGLVTAEVTDIGRAHGLRVALNTPGTGRITTKMLVRTTAIPNVGLPALNITRSWTKLANSFALLLSRNSSAFGRPFRTR